MKIECRVAEEHEDGSATITIDTDKEGTEFLCSYAVSDILTRAWEQAMVLEGRHEEVKKYKRARVKAALDPDDYDRLKDAPF